MPKLYVHLQTMKKPAKFQRDRYMGPLIYQVDAIYLKF